MMHENEFLSEVESYYSARIRTYGESPQGVDWNGADGQRLRFEQLLKIVNLEREFSINDLGCGYGALLDCVSQNYEDYSYTGYDISDEMIKAGRKRYKENSRARFALGHEPDGMADYGIASGIFNVKVSASETEWESYIQRSLDILNQTSRCGFAFNCLTSYSDATKTRPNLYYADPCIIFDLCKQRYSRNVALLHDYDLYEFTVLVRKVV